ncbi:MAG: tripartite tricarboxylate transporter substrate-binding protein [Betaproteobacteria bacterium]
MNTAQAWRPQGTVELIAGTPPGGGLDRTARALARAIAATCMLDVPLKVTNIPGDGARKAWTCVEHRAGDPHALAISSPNLTTDRLTGLASFDHANFTPLAILYNEYIAFIVRADSALGSAAELLRRFGSQPDKLTVALSTALGNPNHIALAKVIRHAGGNIKAVKLRVFDSALDALADVVSGDADLAAITAASAVDALAAGQVRALAVSAPKRLSGLYADAPAWAEHAVDCAIGAWRGITAPRGLTTAQMAYWESVLDAAVKTDAWRADLLRHYWTGMYLAGAGLQQYLQHEAGEFRATLGELGLLAG